MPDTIAQHTRGNNPPLHILISGSGGLIGSALIPHLEGAGHRMTRLVRSAQTAPARAVSWNPAAGVVNPLDLEGFDAVVHLAGENLAGGRWTKTRRERIWNSRVYGTRLLCDALAKTRTPPRVLLAASGTGFYGDGGDAELTEASPAGRGYLADLVRAWEEAADPARAAGVRVVNFRMGNVLSPLGGSLRPLLLPFWLGLGSVIAPGGQRFGWVALDDVLAAFEFALHALALQGPVNLTAPHAVSQRDFARTLGRVLRRPVPFKLPLLAIRLMFSPQLAEAVAWDQNIVPARLLASGYTFRFPELDHALRHVLDLRPAS